MQIPKLSLRAKLLGLAVLPAFAFAAASSSAQAGALASSVLRISNFTLSIGGTPLNVATDFTSLSGSNTATVFADLASVPGAASTTQFSPVAVAPFGQVDLAAVCQGPGCNPVAENNFNVFTPPPTGHFAYSDQRLVGSALDTPLGPAGVDVDTRADVSLTSTDSGAANSSSGTNVSFVFAPAVSGAVTVSFDYEVDLEAFVDPAFGINFAQASSAWNLSVREQGGPQVFSLSPGEINNVIGADAVNPFDSYSASGFASGTTPVLTAGTTYTLNINHQTRSDAAFVTPVPVPEPATLALLGSGIVALGLGSLLSRRRRKEAVAA